MDFNRRSTWLLTVPSCFYTQIFVTFTMPSLLKSVPDPSSPLKYNTALRDLRSVLRLIGIDPTGYGEHSGRHGGTTAAAAKVLLWTNLRFKDVGVPNQCHV